MKGKAASDYPQIINSMIKGRPKDAGSLSIGIRPIHPSSNDNAVENVSIEEYRSAFFFKLERELEKVGVLFQLYFAI